MSIKMRVSLPNVFLLTICTAVLFSVHAHGAKTFQAADALAVDTLAADALNNKLTLVDTKKADKGTVLVFLSAKCPCSASHEEVLKKLYAEFHQKGFQFFAIHSNTDEDSAMTKSHFSQSNLPFPILQDDKAKIANELGALKTPHVFLLNPNGDVEFQGGVDDSNNAAHAKKPFLKEAMLALLDGKKPDPKEVRALGCIIKRD